MRTFEWVLLAAVAVALFLPVTLATRLKRGRMAGALILALIAELIIDGVRWQLWPLYLAAVGLAIGDVLWDERRVRGWPRIRRAMGGTVGIVLVALAPLAMPVPELPAPSGPYAVGTSSAVIVDLEREEIYGLPEPADEPADAPVGQDGEDPEEQLPPRRFVVQVWYPAADAPDEPRPPWNPDWDVVGPAMARDLGFPGFVLGHLEELEGWSKPNLPILSGRLPVVIYSHGWTGFRTIALNQIESLASHGYIVIAADHTYGAIATRFPNGDVVYLDERALPDRDEDDYQEASEQLVETFADDLVAIVDQLEAGEDGVFARFSDHLDLDHIGVFGHSTGGGAAVRFCIEDDRCDAVLGQDAWVEPVPDRIIAEELAQPSLFMRSDGWVDTPNDRRLRGLAERSEQESYWMAIRGAEHNDFVMTPLLSPVADRLGLKGPIPADTVVPTLDTYVVAFFDRYLYQFGGAPLDERPPPEVDLEFLP